MKTARHGLTAKTTIVLCICVVAVALAVTGIFTLKYWNLLPQKIYTAKDFGIKTIKSDVDKNKNGVDDYTDIMLGAREYVETKPRYISKYYAGGYPPDGEGVCTDVIWKAFRHAGYSLKDLVDNDIMKHRNCYPAITVEDKNIDFRRVRNLIFFQAKSKGIDTQSE